MILMLRAAGAISITTEDQLKRNKMSLNITNTTIITPSVESKLYQIFKSDYSHDKYKFFSSNVNE